MNYKDAVNALKNALTFGIEPSLEGVRMLCEVMGNPQESFDALQIAGTNGKSSTARFTAAALRGAGLNVGLYTSPELVEYKERMAINGIDSSYQGFADGINAALQASIQGNKQRVLRGLPELSITEFELLTAAAFWLFAREGVDVAVLEVGLGGRWDATSIVDPEGVAITGIALDHTRILGNTLAEIAGEKAAVITKGKPAVLGVSLKKTPEALEVIEDFAQRAQVVPLWAQPDENDEWIIQEKPLYQRENVATALALSRAYIGEKFPELSIGIASKQAIKECPTPGRFDIVSRDPFVMIDAAHNPQSASVTAQALKRLLPTVKGECVLLLAVLADKDYEGIVKEVEGLFTSVVITQTSSLRAMDAGELSEIVRAHGMNVEAVFSDVPSSIKFLQGRAYVAMGSITLAGEVKAVLSNL